MGNNHKKLSQEQAIEQILSLYSVGSRYFIGVDPYDRLNWLQNLLKKTGLFYKNRPKSSCGVFLWKKDGSVEFIKQCPNV